MSSHWNLNVCFLANGFFFVGGCSGASESIADFPRYVSRMRAISFSESKGASFLCDSICELNDALEANDADDPATAAE